MNEKEFGIELQKITNQVYIKEFEQAKPDEQPG